MMRLAKLEPVKTLLDIDETETEFDELLMQLIENVSGEVEDYLGRVVQVPQSAGVAAEITEYFDVSLHTVRVRVSAYPVISVTDIRSDTDRTFATSSIVDSKNYYIDSALGIITFKWTMLDIGPGALKVIYKGGMALTTDAFISAYPAINSAVNMEVAARFQRKATLGVVALAMTGGSVTYIQQNQFLPGVQSILDGEVRTAFE